MSKQQFIQSQRLLYPNESIPEFVSILNTRSVPTTRQIPVPIAVPSISEIAVLMPDVDNLLIENTYKGTYDSIKENAEKGLLRDVAQSIKNLLAGDISPEGKAILQQVLDGIRDYLTNPPTQDIEVMLSPAEVAGVGDISIGDVLEAL
jgi:hypothetical protein